jgi:hypothetical protein
MKNGISEELAHKLTNRQFMRKLKIFLGVGLVGVIMVGALVIWAGIATIKGVTNLAQDTKVSEKVLSLQTEVVKIATLPGVGCWQTAQGLLHVEVWLEKPIADNLHSLKLACMSANKE